MAFIKKDKKLFVGQLLMKTEENFPQKEYVF